MKGLVEFINEELFKEDDIRLHIVDIPEIVEYIQKLFGNKANRVERADGWLAFRNKNVMLSDDYEVPREFKKDVDADDFYEFMSLFMPYFEDADEINPKDVLDKWEKSDDKFKEAVKAAIKRNKEENEEW